MKGLLRDDAFRRVWGIGACAGIMRWLDMLATGVYVFEVTASPLLVAIITLMRLMPMLAGAFIGAFAERLPIRSMLVASLGAITGIYAVLTVLAFTGWLEIWHIGIGAMLVGLYWASEMSVRRTLLGEIAGAERLGSAMGLDWAAVNSTRLIGPLAGGALYAEVGVGGTYLCGALLFGLATLLAAGLTAGREARGKSSRNVLADIADGLRFAAARPVVMGILAVTVVMNALSFPYSSMVPVIGKDVLGASPVAVGLLTSAEGVGALVGSFILANIVRPAWYGRTFVMGSAVCLSAALVFGLSSSYVFSLAVLVGLGLGSAAFATMQSTMMLTNAPPEQRSRMMGVLSSTIGTGQVGLLHMGLLADHLGAPVAVAVSMAEGLVLLALCVRFWPALWRGD
ncbi:MAG: MFS transporter [Alphaproteobacteria bacterium]|nr:MFS transporter [Alphaproteobacteria bacterium]